MDIKYHCPTCGRIFVEWGAVKLEFKCPTEACSHAELVLPEAAANSIVAKPKSKRTKKTIMPIANPEERISELDRDLVDDDNNNLDAAADIETYDDNIDDDIVVDDDEPVILEEEAVETESYPSDKTKRSQPVGDTKGKKEKSKAQKQKSVKDATAAKVKKDKAPKSKAS